MLRNKPIELWVDATICVHREDECYWNGAFEKATASADTLEWDRDSSWESFDSETAERAQAELEKTGELARGLLEGVSVYELLRAADELLQEGDHDYIELGGKSVNLGDGRRLAINFTLDVWWA